METEEYFHLIKKEVEKEYSIARKAREKGLDPVNDVEIPIAMTLAEKSVGLISTLYPQIMGCGIVERISELEKEYGPLDMAVAFKIAEEIAKEKFCKFESFLQAMEAGVRVGFSYITLGVVSSPIEGFTELKIKKTRDNQDYLAAYFSGPIRSSGTTASCMVLMLIDYLRELFGFAKYDPTEDEIKRYITENYDYHERVTNLQYLPTEEEIAFLARNLPIQICGEPTEQREVSNYMDLARVETNFIRGGMCLIFSEGLAQKAAKGLRLWNGLKAKGFKMSGWDFLEEYVNVIHKKREKGSADSSPTYIKDLVAGRPVFSHPSRSGGFRFRYGRSRASGFSAACVHPATMGITDNFISFGTQLKIEKPTKGCAVGVCDEIDGPIVRLKDGSVKRVETLEEAQKIYKEVEEIIYLGDILISFGDLANRNYELIKPGYVEEWWELELKKKIENSKLPYKNRKEVSFEEAKELSEKYAIPLHPKYIYFWTEITLNQFRELVKWIKISKIDSGKLILPFNLSLRQELKEAKRALELLGCEHFVFLDNVIIKENETKAFLANLGIDYKEGLLKDVTQSIFEKISEKPVLEIVNEISKFKIKDKAGSFIGARMGRPEKAKLRKLIGSPHSLFPVGKEGGRLRSFQEAMGVGYVEAEFPIFICEKCNSETIYPRCERCNSFCKKVSYNAESDLNYIGNSSEKEKISDFVKKRININHYFNMARKLIGVRNGEIVLVKGIRGTSNKEHICENLAKGLLRAKYNLCVNKDGTIRYDMTEMPITHFKPKEIETSIDKLKELGYKKDFYGNDLENDEQILELFPHDIILPSCPFSDDEKADDVFLKISKFIDDELEYVYGLERFYNAKSKEDLVGHLFVNIAPHICTATVGRLIGFSKSQSFLASPFMHAAMRRDCDGDECATMLLMDLLLNFSRKYLPAHRGGTQDAPLVLNTMIKAGDVDDQILDFETGEYPLELYEMAEIGKHSSEVKFIETIRTRLKKGINPFKNIIFSHNCFNINHAVLSSSYKVCPTMQDKVQKQMNLDKKIRAVDISDVARLVIERHFIRDTRGNLRKFSMQVFRCVSCNEKFRRPPLIGKCTKCGGRIIFTISEGSILKYMKPALDIAREFKVSDYLLENLELNQMYVESIFGREIEKQEALGKWF